MLDKCNMREIMIRKKKDGEEVEKKKVKIEHRISERKRTYTKKEKKNQLFPHAKLICTGINQLSPHK